MNYHNPKKGVVQDSAHATTEETPPLKRCTMCGEKFPPTLQYWGKDGSRPDGLRIYCKPCRASNERRYRAENPEKSRAAVRRYSATHREKKKEIQRRYVLANQDEVRERERIWRVNNRDTVLRTARLYRENNREKLRIEARTYRRRNPAKIRNITRHHARLRRTRRAQALQNFTLSHEYQALEYFHNCCAVCGRQLKDLFGTHTVHFDHWQPLSKGGQTTPDNMIPLCGGQGGCNNSKSDTNPVDWLALHHTPAQVKKILARIEAYFAWIKSLEGGAS